MTDTKPGGGPGTEEPHWKQDFSVDWDVTEYISRREFTRFLGLSSAIMGAGTTALAVGGQLREAPGKHDPKMIAKASEVSPGTAMAFEYPKDGHYCLLVRHEDGSFSAFSQKCPHLGCAVYYETKSKELECPCHEGFFNARDGEVISGPPQRGLARVELETRGDEIWAIGGGE